MLGLSKYSCCERAGKEISISLTIREREKVGNVLWLPIPLEIRYHTAYLPIFKRWKEKYNLLRFAIFFSNKLICGKVGNISHEHDFGFWMGSQTSFQLRTEFEWVFNISWALPPLTQISSSNSSHARNLSHRQTQDVEEHYKHRLPGQTQDVEELCKRQPSSQVSLLQKYESMYSCDQLPSQFCSSYLPKVWSPTLPGQTQDIVEETRGKLGQDY